MMQMIDRLFLKIAEMSLTAGIVILVVLFVRLLLRGMPKSFSYVLWLVVAFRLAVPFSADTRVSVFNLIPQNDGFFRGGFITGNQTVRMELSEEKPSASTGRTTAKLLKRIGLTAVKQTYDVNFPELMKEPMKEIKESPADSAALLEERVQAEQRSDIPGEETATARLVSVLSFVWIAGILTLVSYTIMMHVMLKKRLRYSVQLYENLYECDTIRSPFVYGLFLPKIYMPFRLNEDQRYCVLAHERYHLQRKDHLIKSFAYALVVVYWFQPLVWVAYRLMSRDMEMSCDEKVTSAFTDELRGEYSRLLLAFAANKRQMPVSPLAFGEENTMARIKNILAYKKPAKWKMIGSTMALMLTMAACATDAKEAPVTELTEVSSDSVSDSIADSENEVRVRTTDGSEVVIPIADQDKTGGRTQRQLTHQQAQWAENSWCDLEFISLDYADADKIIFHISSGLFEYDLLQQQITQSIDLKALNCQAVQTGGECSVQIYQDHQNESLAVIQPYPYHEPDGYVYYFDTDELYTYDTSLLEGYTVYDGLVSKRELPEGEKLKNRRIAENVLPLGNDTYGALHWNSVELANMYYEAGEQKWMLFQKEQATLPRLDKQDESFYQSLSHVAGESVHQCSIEYEALYNMHDYDGVCALATDLEYSDELRQEFSKRTDKLSFDQEISHSDDEQVYLFQYSCTDEEGNENKVYLNFRNIEGQGWRAEGLPASELTYNTSSVQHTEAKPINTAESSQVYADSANGEWSAYVTDDDFCTVYVRNNSTGKIKEIGVDEQSMLATAVYDLHWINQDTLGVIAHVNPSTSFLCVYRMPDCESIDSHYGISFQWASDDYRSLYYIEPAPHFSEQTGPEAVMNYQEQAVFATNGGSSLSYLSVSPNGDRLAFFSIDEEREKKDIYIIEHLKEGMEQRKNTVQSIAWEYPAGELQWTDDTVITVNTQSGKKELHIDTGEISDK